MIPKQIEYVPPNRTVVGFVGKEKKRILYRIEIEITTLQYLALSAAANKTKRATRGPIAVTALEVEDVAT